MRIFLRSLLLKVVRLIETWANFCWGKEKSESGDAGSTLALVRQNIVQALCTYAEAVKQQIMHAKH